MKKSFMFLFMLIAIFLTNGTTFADVLTYHDGYVDSHSVDTSGTTPVYWAKLGFPDNTTLGGTYTPNVLFEYNSYYSQNQVNALAITLHGTGDNSNLPIDIWLSFKNGTHPDKFRIASFDVPTSNAFTLIFDIKNNALLYNGGSGNQYEGTLLNGVSLQSFVTNVNGVDIDQFWVGYGCHFTHLETDVDVSVGSNQAPEPATMLLLGSGLACLLGFRRKFKN